jgi:translation initiation factor IF-3
MLKILKYLRFNSRSKKRQAEEMENTRKLQIKSLINLLNNTDSADMQYIYAEKICDILNTKELNNE